MLSDAARAWTAAVWQHRALTERQARDRFRRISADFRNLGRPDEFVRAAVEASADESRHERMCHDLVRAFGAEPLDDPPPPPPIAPSRLKPEDALLYETVAACALSETMNAALLTLTLQHVDEPAICTAVHDILRDEVQHARLGWAHLAWEAKRRDCSFLAIFLPKMLDAALSEEALIAKPARPEEDEFRRAGNLSWSLRLGSIRDTLRDVVVPGLELHRVPTAPLLGWIDSRLVDVP